MVDSLKIQIIDGPKIILRGIGQVIFQNNALSGLLFLIGIAINNLSLAGFALLGTLLSTLTAVVLNFQPDNIKEGLFGFNGTLVGICLPVFFGVNMASFVSILIASIISTLIMQFFIKKKIPPFTFPFVLVSWLGIAVMFGLGCSIQPSPVEGFHTINYWEAYTKNFGQIMFQNNIMSGVFFALGLLVNSPKALLYGSAASLLAIVYGIIFGYSLSDINMGIIGYNAILCAVALQGNTWLNYILTLFSVILSIILLQIGSHLGLIMLTAPFVFATWITLFIKRLILSKRK